MEQRHATTQSHSFGRQFRPTHATLHATLTTALHVPNANAFVRTTIPQPMPLSSITAEHASQPPLASLSHSFSQQHATRNHLASDQDTLHSALSQVSLSFPHTAAVARQDHISVSSTARPRITTSHSISPSTLDVAKVLPHTEHRQHGSGGDQLDKPLQQLQRLLLWFIALSLLLCILAPPANASAQQPQDDMSFITRQPTPPEPPSPLVSDPIRQQGQCRHQVCWQVSPVLCPSNDTDSSCQLQLSVRWSSAAPISPCLHLDQRQLHCWAKSMLGQSQHQLRLSQHANVTLRDASGILLEQQIAVLQRQPKQRARLMMPWSIF